MSRIRLVGATFALLCLVGASATARAAVIGFVGPWAPTIENGFQNATGGGSLFTTSVSPDGGTLTSSIASNGNFAFNSFFLESYGYSFATPILLPTGLVAFNWSITNTGAAALNLYGDQGVPTTSLAPGASVSGSFSTNFTGGYFEYFGVNISDLNATAQANVVLTNFSGPGEVPEPISIALFATGLAGLALSRRRAA